ncbi:Aste57867_7718 [Aphanomyces stellatus]|uniref:Centrosomal protein of 70 kDa n=1 Tax=Aphanomyces stellatus TaxID=120398 RepID=A0A485KIP9_9STRA|nr:hypothetical protein As57867_007689 [Aphanomyces stellatus]VFT84621.1 Aste57867_7718 [Aphanomyces stellatus]
MKVLLQRAQCEIDSLKVEIKNMSAKSDIDQKSFKIQKSKLEQQIKISEHRVKAKEILLDRLQQKFQQQVDKDECSKSKNKEIFRKIQQRDPKKANAADLKSMEIIGMYENERRKMHGEINLLRNQVQELCCEVRDKENMLARQHGDKKIVNHDAFVDRLEKARFEQETASRQLRQKESLIQEKIKQIEGELRQSKEVILQLREENANLHLEVESRPTIRDYKATQRRLLLLERQLSDQKLAMNEATDIEELRKYVGTAELIRRDKSNAKLQLNRLSTLPKDTCVEIIQDICRQLELTDVTLIGPSLSKMISVVQAVPRMEKIIRETCRCLSTASIIPLEKIIPTLCEWKRNLAELENLQKYAADSIQVLSTRSQSIDSMAGPISHKRAIQIIKELVEFESHFMEERELYQLAMDNAQKHPDILVNRMVQHFRHLFGVKTMEGVFPKINEVFLYVNEMNNALGTIKSALGLASDISVTNSLNALKHALENVGSRPKKIESVNYVVTKDDEVAGGAQVRQQHMILKKLKHEMGAQSIEELIPRTKR